MMGKPISFPLRGESLTLVVFVVLSVTLMILPSDTRILVADRLGLVLTSPYWRVRDFGQDVFQIRDDNAWLKKRVTEMELLVATGERIQRDADRMAGPALDPGYDGDLVPCRVVMRQRARFATMIKVHSVIPVAWRAWQPVISSEGYLGRLCSVINDREAWVELMIAPEFALGVEIERTGLLGVLRPRGDRFVLEMIGRDEDVQLGDTVITSGIAEIREGADRLGVDVVIDPSATAAEELVGIVGMGGASEVIQFADGKLVMVGGIVTPNAPITGGPLRDLRIRQAEWGWVVAALVRDGRTIVAHGDTLVRTGDHAVLMTTDDRVDDATKILGLKRRNLDRAIIMGGTRLAELTADVMSEAGLSVVIIDEDADLEDAVERIAFGAFYQSGQSCIGVQRIIAHDSIYERLRDRLVEKTARYRVSLVTDGNWAGLQGLGFERVVTAEVVVDRWREEFPGATIGVMTGQAVYPTNLSSRFECYNPSVFGS